MNALPPAVAEKLDQVRALCEKHHVRRLTLFGSAVKGTFDEEASDLDFVVEFLPGAAAGGLRDSYFRLLVDLQELFAREIDLVERAHIENPYFLQVLDLTQRPVYESAPAA